MALTGPGANSPRRRILLLTPRWPYPVLGGDRLRIWHLAREVSRRHEVTLLSLCQTEAEMACPLPADGVFTSAYRVLLPRWRSWSQMLAALPSAVPLQIAYYWSAAFRREVQRLEPLHDLLWCHLVRMAPYAAGSSHPRWLEMTDAISMTMTRAAQARPRWNPARLLFAMEASRLRAAEADAARRFDLVTVVSEVDRNAIEAVKNPSAPPIVAPNGVEIPASPIPVASTRPPGIALLGRMDSLANRDALHYFTREIWPQVRAARPQARLHVIGHVLDNDARQLARLEGVTIHGVVADLHTVLTQCRVGVCPVRIGAGMQNKLLDYMAHGLAAVTSPVGLEGLGAVAGRHVLVAEATHEWVTAIDRLLQDDGLTDSIAREGQSLVRLSRRWPDSLSPALRELERLLIKPSLRAPEEGGSPPVRAAG